MFRGNGFRKWSEGLKNNTHRDAHRNEKIGGALFVALLAGVLWAVFRTEFVRGDVDRGVEFFLLCGVVSVVAVALVYTERKAFLSLFRDLITRVVELFRPRLLPKPPRASIHFPKR